jgi:hypothetical protein
MTHTAKPRAIEFIGDITALAVTLGMAVDDIAAAIGALIARGHLQRITGRTWRLKPHCPPGRLFLDPFSAAKI